MFINIRMSHNHNSIHVKCSTDEPLQLLIDKLSTKSSQLYIFWQNYNQMYNQYNERLLDIERLKQENDLLRRQKSRSQPSQDNYYRDRVRVLQTSCQNLKNEIDHLKEQYTILKFQNVRVQQDSLAFQELIQKLREENNIQKITIEKILTQLKNLQLQIVNYSKLYEDSLYKQTLINKFIQKQNQLHQCIANREDSIQSLMRQIRQIKNQYQLIIQETIINTKNKILQSLPELMKISRQKVRVLL